MVIRHEHLQELPLGLVLQLILALAHQLNHLLDKEVRLRVTDQELSQKAALFECR